MEPEITIRKAETLADYQACQAAQRILTGSDPGFRPLRVRIQAVRVTSA